MPVVLMLRASRPSVRLSVTLVDYDHIVQQKLEMSIWQDSLVSWLPAAQSRRVVVGLFSDPENEWSIKNVEFCTSAAISQKRASCALDQIKTLIGNHIWQIEWYHVRNLYSCQKIAFYTRGIRVYDGSRVALSEHLLSFLSSVIER